LAFKSGATGIRGGGETSMHYFLMLGRALCTSHKKLVGARYTDLYFCIRCEGHVVYFGASGCKMSTQYFSYSGGPGADTIKLVPTLYAKLMFLYLV
jgi:hypothetical protein